MNAAIYARVSTTTGCSSARSATVHCRPALSCELKDADRTLAWLHFRSEEDARGFEMSSYDQGKRNFSSASFEDKPMFEDS